MCRKHCLWFFRNQQANFASYIIENSVDTLENNGNKDKQTNKVTLHEIDWLTNRFLLKLDRQLRFHAQKC